MTTLFFATHNAKKLAEVRALLSPAYAVQGLDDLGISTAIPETSNTFAGNAQLKVDYLHQQLGVDGFAEDSGLEVAALGGAPGVFSARYAGPEQDDAANLARLLAELAGNTQRQARFVTVIALQWQGAVHFFEGSIAGEITLEPRGTGTFGYDPVFQPTGYTRTFAEMSTAEKNLISHRGLAIKQLADFLAKF